MKRLPRALRLPHQRRDDTGAPPPELTSSLSEHADGNVPGGPVQESPVTADAETIEQQATGEPSVGVPSAANDAEVAVATEELAASARTPETDPPPSPAADHTPASEGEHTCKSVTCTCESGAPAAAQSPAAPELQPSAGRDRSDPLRRVRFLVSPIGAVWRRGYPADALAVAVITGLTVLFYRALLFTDRIAADPMLLRLVYPYRQFAAGALRDGRLPLWNPYLFTGVPFLADPRAGALYPPNLALRWLDAPDAFVWSVVGHGWLAAVGMYALLRGGLDRSRPAALTGAVIFAFGGFLGANAIEPNVVEAGAWLPLVLLGADVAMRRHIAYGVGLASLALALQLLAGQPHIAALSLLAAALLVIVRLVPLGALAQRPPREWWRPVGVGLTKGLIVVVTLPAFAFALAAAQLLPTWELYRRSVRNASWSYSDATAGALPPSGLVRALLPGFNEDPERLLVAYAGIVALGLAVAGLRRGTAAATLGALLFSAGLFEALGDATPVHQAVYSLLRGYLRLDHPTRGLLLVACGAAIAASSGLDILWRREPGQVQARRWRSLGVPAALFAIVAMPFAWAISSGDGFDLPTGGVREIWLGLAVIAVDIAVLLPFTRPRRWVGLAVCGAVMAELMIAGAQLPFTVSTPPLTYDAGSTLASLLQSPAAPARLGRSAGIAEEDVLLPGFAEYTAARLGRDHLAPDFALLEGVNTLEGLQTALLPTTDIIEALGVDARTRRSPFVPLGGLPEDPAGTLGPRLGVTHVFGPPAGAARAGEVEFLLGRTIDIGPGAEYTLAVGGDRQSTGIALLTELLSGPADGQPAVEIVVTDTGGAERRRTFVSGVETGDPASLPSDRVLALTDGRLTVPAQQPFGRPGVFRGVTLRNLTPAGTLRVRALSLIDERTGQSLPVSLGETLRPIRGTDPTIYEDTRTPPRASLTRDFIVEPDAAATRRSLADLPSGVIALDRPPRLSTLSMDGAAQDQVRISRYAPEKVEVIVSAVSPAVLVLRDTYYPGWQVRIDGEPAELLRADGLFRAVAVPAGTHTVAFDFAPDSLRFGAIISVAALGVLAGGALLLVRLPGGRRSAPPQR